MVKRILVVDYNNTMESIDFSATKYSVGKRFWSADFTIENKDSIVTEYCLNINRKLTLIDMIDVLRKKLDLVPEDSPRFGFKLYHIKGKK